jgi:hypothetical protein
VAANNQSISFTCEAANAEFTGTLAMESIIRSVKDIETDDRRALEHVIGRGLDEDQQLVIQVISPNNSSTDSPEVPGSPALPGWCNVYEGLSDAELADLEEVVLTRADLSRDRE